MGDWSQGSAYPSGGATADRVSDHESDTNALVSRWAELYRLLLAPATEGFALRAVPGQAPVRESSGDPAELIAQAEHAGAGKAVWAIVAPVRPDLLVIDLDHCADLVLRPILDSVDDAAAQVAYLAASGSRDSVHVAIACPSGASRAYLLDRIRAIRAAEGLSPTTLDIRTATQFLRLPGSAPLKPGGGWCHPIDETGQRMTAPAATRRAHRAVLELPATLVGLPAVTATDRTRPSAASAGSSTSKASAGDTESASTTSSARMDDDLDVDPGSTSADALEQPCAWRPRKPFTARQWAILHHTPTEGHRSHAATAAAWVLWQYGIRSWQRAAGWYRTCPAFTKFAGRDDHGRAHWETIRARAVSYRPQDPAGDDLIRTVLTEISCWDDAELVAAAVACITHRFSDGHGVDNRPIAWRDLALWLNISHTAAGRRLHGLIDRGLLHITTPHDRATAPHAATCYSLRTPPEIYRTDLHHDVTQIGAPQGLALLHPIWGTLTHTAHWLWSHLSPTTSLPTSALAQATGLPPGTTTHGALRLLRELEKHGLATREGKGRATRWFRGSQSLTTAAAACGADTHHHELHTIITGERAAWHAPTVRRSKSLHARLRAYRRQQNRPRQRVPEETSATPQLPLVFGPAKAPPQSRRTQTHLRRSRPPGRGPT